MSGSLRLYGRQHARLPCPSPSTHFSHIVFNPHSHLREGCHYYHPPIAQLWKKGRGEFREWVPGHGWQWQNQDWVGSVCTESAILSHPRALSFRRLSVRLSGVLSFLINQHSPPPAPCLPLLMGSWWAQPS